MRKRVYVTRTLAEALVNEIMDAQAEDACAEGNQRNGHRERQLLTSVEQASNIAKAEAKPPKAEAHGG